MCTPTQGVWQPAGCVSCEPVCVCVSLVRVVIICLASTHTALVSSPSLAVLHLSTYLPTCLCAPVPCHWEFLFMSYWEGGTNRGEEVPETPPIFSFLNRHTGLRFSCRATAH